MHVADEFGKLAQFLRRLDPDGRQLEDIGAELPQARGQAAGLLPRPRDHDAPAKERARLEPIEPVAQTHHAADHRHRRRLKAGRHDLLRNVRECAPQRLLPAGRPPAHQGDQGFRRRAVFDELRGDHADPLDAHEHHFRSGRLRELRKIEGTLSFGGIFVPGENGELRGVIAMRHGNARVGRRGDRGADARDDLELQTRLRERLGFLAASSENKRVATLQPHHPPAGAGLLDQQRIDLLLLQRVLPGLLARVDQFHARRRPG